MPLSRPLFVGKVQISERLVPEILPNNSLTPISRGSCFVDGGKEHSDQINGGMQQKETTQQHLIGAGVLLPCGFAGHWFPEPIRGKFKVSET